MHSFLKKSIDIAKENGVWFYRRGNLSFGDQTSFLVALSMGQSIGLCRISSGRDVPGLWLIVRNEGQIYSKRSHITMIGVMRNKDGKQQVSFEGMNDGYLCFSSIEAVQEYRNKAYIILIPKYNYAPLSSGLRIMYSRLICDLTMAGKFAVAAVVSHQASYGNPIILKDCMVSQLKIGYNPWREPTRPATALELRNYFIRLVDRDFEKAMSLIGKPPEIKAPSAPNRVNNSSDAAACEDSRAEVVIPELDIPPQVEWENPELILTEIPFESDVDDEPLW